jgi:hypothetical protein
MIFRRILARSKLAGRRTMPRFLVIVVALGLLLGMAPIMTPVAKLHPSAEYLSSCTVTPLGDFVSCP